MTFEQIMQENGVHKLNDYIPYNKWQCRKKVAFPTVESAKLHAKCLKHKMRVYKCNICGDYHLTRDVE